MHADATFLTNEMSSAVDLKEKAARGAIASCPGNPADKDVLTRTIHVLESHRP